MSTQLNQFSTFQDLGAASVVRRSVFNDDVSLTSLIIPDGIITRHVGNKPVISSA